MSERKKAQVMTLGLHDFDITGDVSDVWVVITMTALDLSLIRASLQVVFERTGDTDYAVLLEDLQRAHYHG